MKKSELEAEIVALNNELTSCEEEITYLRELLDPQVREVHIEKGTAQMEVSSPLITNIAIAFAQYFIDIGAENYLEFTFFDKDQKGYIVTFQKKDGQTPHEMMEYWKNLYFRHFSELNDNLPPAL